MVLDFCPGSQKFRQPQPEIIKCSNCGEEVEIWTDEVQATCSKCKTIVTRESGSSCLDWCKYAKECVGEQTYNKFMQNKAITTKQKLLKKLEEYFGKDTKRINHAKKVMGFAEEILKKEKADWHIVIPASILHDVGIKVAEEKYGSSAGHLQEKEGPKIAREILLKVGLNNEDADEICQIIAHHHSPGKVDTQNFKVLYDADWLVNFADSGYWKEYISASRTDKKNYVREKDEVDTNDKTKLKSIINKVFLTKTGRELAERIYFK